MYPDDRNVLGGYPETATISGYKKRWILSKQSKVLEVCVRMHSELFDVPQLPLPGVQFQIKFTDGKNRLSPVGKPSDAKAVFKFLDATLFAKHAKPSPSVQLAQRNALEKFDAQ
jgi:hypothetical protein